MSRGHDKIASYYNLAQEEILIKRKQIKEFITVPKLLGDFYEEIIRDYLKAHIPPQFKVKSGVVANPQKDITSKECDIIIYDSQDWLPLFNTESMAIVPNYCVRAVIEVKSSLTTRTIDQTNETFRSVHEIENAIPCFLVGFESGRVLETMNEQICGEGKLFIFSKRNGDIIPDQLGAFMQHIRSKLSNV